VTGREVTRPAELAGFHHVRVPVSDVLVSRDFYAEVFGLEPVMVVEEEDRIIGVVLGHGSGVVVGLHEAPERARALRGFAVLGLSCPDLAAWVDRLDRLGIRHGPMEDRHLGRCVLVADPDGILVALHSLELPSVDIA